MHNKVADAFLATVFCLAIFQGLLYIAGSLFHEIDKLKPLANQIGDIELSDYSFAFTHKRVNPDSSIMIINCAADSGDVIAEKIGRIEQAGPKAIGLDILLEDSAGQKGNLKLIDTISKYRSNMVLAAIFDAEDRDKGFVVGEGGYHVGYLEKGEATATKRKFQPIILSGKSEDTSFAVLLTRIAGEHKAIGNLARRDRKEELINFRRSVDQQGRYSISDTVPSSDKLKGKIVIFGVCGSGTLQDKYYTPLNGSFGRSHPDTFGCIYQAQILSMLLLNDYVDELPAKRIWVFLTCFLFMLLFMAAYRYPVYYHFILVAVWMLLLVLLMGMSHYFLELFSIKFEPRGFAIPVFMCGLLLHLYFPAKKAFLGYLRKIV